MRSCDPLANVIAPVPDQFPAIPANGPAPCAALFSMPSGANRPGANRPNASARAATLSEAAGAKRANSRCRIAPLRGRALSGRQVEYVIEVRFPAGDEGLRHRTQRRAPIRSTNEDRPSRTMDIRKSLIDSITTTPDYTDAGAASMAVRIDSAELRPQQWGRRDGGPTLPGTAAIARQSGIIVPGEWLGGRGKTARSGRLWRLRHAGDADAGAR